MTQQQVQVQKTESLNALVASDIVRKRFEEIVGKRANAFLSSVQSAVNSNKALADCEPKSIVAAAAMAAVLDLPISPGLGLAHIVPYKGKAQFQIGWKGFVQLALRSGQYKTIHMTPVMEGQLVENNPFTGELKFDAKAKSSEKRAGYLLYFKLLNGYEKYFYMTTEECQAHGKKYSMSFKKNFGVWVDDFDAMALKTVVKLGLSKYGILSVEMQKALESDQAEIGDDGEPKYVDNQEEDKAARIATEIGLTPQVNEKEVENYDPNFDKEEEKNDAATA